MSTRTKGALAMVLAGAVTFSISAALLVEQSPKELIKRSASALNDNLKKTDIISRAEKTVNAQTPAVNDKKDVQTKVSSNPSALEKVPDNKNTSDAAIALVDENTKNVSKKTAEKSATNKQSDTAVPAPSAATRPETSVKPTRKTAVAVSPVPETTTARPAPKPSAPKQVTSKVTSPTKTETRIKAPVTTTDSASTTTKKDRTATAPSAPVKSIPATPAATKSAASPKAPAARTASATKGTNPANSAVKPANRGQEVSQTAKEKAAINKEQKGNKGEKL
ncbi:hypothetical protein [Mesobacillus foraminis]|uniref:Uncharacterized protein n=1 Tax=Mesobacillus foraminis TaxID=279826 RepID=A0A4R2B8B8_9BACI|nr:hypothetical protein [Mesobacillus foraminis]TCN22583.1 hypothetical protein EV146_11067 [Mesobacillus foraminis]